MNGHIRRRVMPRTGTTRYYPVITIDGKRQQLGGFALKKDAEACLRRVQREIADGTYGKSKPGAIRFDDFYSQWIKSKARSLKPSTRASYEHTFRLHVLPCFAEKQLSEISPMAIQAWVNQLSEKDLAPASVARCYRYLRASLKQAEAWGIIDKSPCRSISLPRCNRDELSFLDPGEISLLLDSAQEPERTLFAVLAYSGLRLGEALGLSWKHVNFKENAINVERAWSFWGGFQEPKTATSRRAVPMLARLSRQLEVYYRDSGSPSPDALLFSFGGKKPLDAANVRKEFLRALEQAGLPHVTMHSLRHTFASVLLSSGASIKALQRSLGHASATMTLNTYSHLIQEDLGGALLRADQAFSAEAGQVVQLHASNS